ncbi:hypothetical protein vseg_009506 [Gypsophila vaccaria]
MASSKLRILFLLLSLVLVAHINGAEDSNCVYVAPCETQAQCAAQCASHGYPSASHFCTSVDLSAPNICSCCP